MIPVIPRLHFGLPMQCQPRSERRWKPDALARSLDDPSYSSLTLRVTNAVSASERKTMETRRVSEEPR